ncbi:FAD-dependent oxidoreductase [Rhodococcus rhodochrous]|uniref:Oxidoreductase n=1 Tax=Rhodococcus rhodochrous KG-21 TaxID=1441923 RepID=A0A0M8PKL3_RHORH|nr:FAD-dependent oxidoreductase [Rhodococcus rhodochrous]KOS58206.1 oxidoreductase [Rhodococcus rhodochrous KG-21]
MIDKDFEIIVIGSGLAGLASALTAVERGCREVLVVEAEGVLGGSTRLCGGVVMGSRSRLQTAAGIEDAEDDMFKEYMAINVWDVSAGPVERWAARSGETIDWLQDNGVPFYERLIYSGDDRRPRGHCVEGGGQAIVDALVARCREVGVEFALGNRVDELIYTDGRVTGVRSGGEDLTAEAVIVATGGFGANPEYLAQHYPIAWVPGETFYIGSQGARGDHLKFSTQVDAQLTGENRGLRMLNPGVDTMHEAFLPGWTVLLDKRGHRFCDETAPYGILDSLLKARDNVGYVVFDDAALRPPADLADRYADAYKQVWPNHAKFKPKHYTADVIEQYKDHERIHIAESLDALAESIGIPADDLCGTIARYNHLVETGEDTDFGKAGRFLNPISTAPFYAVEVRPTAIAHTGYGMRIDDHARVIGVDGNLIEGLYAAGECTGGIVGPTYSGSGSSLASAAGIGRMAGEAAADYMKAARA